MASMLGLVSCGWVAYLGFSRIWIWNMNMGRPLLVDWGFGGSAGRARGHDGGFPIMNPASIGAGVDCTWYVDVDVGYIASLNGRKASLGGHQMMLRVERIDQYLYVVFVLSHHSHSTSHASIFRFSANNVEHDADLHHQLRIMYFFLGLLAYLFAVLVAYLSIQIKTQLAS